MTVYKTRGMKAIESNTVVNKWIAKDYIQSMMDQLQVSTLDMRYKKSKVISKINDQLNNMYYTINGDVEVSQLTKLLDQVNSVLED